MVPSQTCYIKQMHATHSDVHLPMFRSDVAFQLPNSPPLLITIQACSHYITLQLPLKIKIKNKVTFFLKCDLFKLVFMHQSYLTFAKTNLSPFGGIFYDKNTIDLTAGSLGKRYCSWQ